MPCKPLRHKSEQRVSRKRTIQDANCTENCTAAPRTVGRLRRKSSMLPSSSRSGCSSTSANGCFSGRSLRSFQLHHESVDAFTPVRSKSYAQLKPSRSRVAKIALILSRLRRLWAASVAAVRIRVGVKQYLRNADIPLVSAVQLLPFAHPPDTLSPRLGSSHPAVKIPRRNLDCSSNNSTTSSHHVYPPQP
jgi:hypothetical protein